MNVAIVSLLLATSAPLPGGDAGPLTLRINLPEARLDVVEGTETVRSYPATIGMPRHPTPTGSYAVTSITWNPWWNPPESDWAKNGKKTPPGPSNPMGRAKLRFDGLLYVHGTTNDKALGTAASHGCIRLANADVLELARFLAERTGALPAEEVAALERSPSRTREVALPGGGVPILIEYRLVRETEAGVQRFDDPYDLGLMPHEEWLLRNAEEAAREAEDRAPAAPAAAPVPGPGLAVSMTTDAPRPALDVEDPMDPRTYGPQIFPSAPLARKRVEARLDQLPPLREHDARSRSEADDQEERGA